MTQEISPGIWEAGAQAAFWRRTTYPHPRRSQMLSDA